MLRETQLQLQELKDANKELTEENKILKANQPKRKKKGQDVSDGHMAFDEEIRLCARKYGACYEMFMLDRQLLQQPNPTSPPLLNAPARYDTPATMEAALLSELFSILPSHIHPLVPDNHFADTVSNSLMMIQAASGLLTGLKFEDAMNSSRATEIKKLRSKAGLIFNLPEHYFTDIGYNRASVPEIQRLLGTTESRLAPKPFPPVLFANLLEDTSLKTIFGNWEVFVKVRY
jgi:FtsZ-binding cell division protein ZapB